MRSKYCVELTKTAEKTYTKLYNEAQAFIKSGKADSPKVSLFAGVEQALDEIIPDNPYRCGWCLAGCLSRIFVCNVGSIRIYYLVGEESGIVLIIRIGQKCATDLSWLRDAVQSGRFDAVVESLGLDIGRVIDAVNPNYN